MPTPYSETFSESVIVAVHAGSKVPSEWEPHIVLDARACTSWPILAESGTDLGALPLLYELQHVNDEWFHSPRTLSKKHRRIVSNPGN